MKPALTTPISTSGMILWFTGLSGSGKTTLSRAVSRALSPQARSCILLDGDELRQTISHDLGFSPADREENVRRLYDLAQQCAGGGTVVLVAAIAPYRQQRDRLRCDSQVPFFEVFVDAPLQICEDRDPKGLYRMVRAGLIREFTGIDALYEAPETPDIHCLTATEPVEKTMSRVVSFLEERLPPLLLQPELGVLGKVTRKARVVAARLWNMRSPRIRSEVFTRLRYKQKHFQSSTHTLTERYPALFAQCRESLEGIPKPRILSFGCSTGEELSSLQRYLPAAELIGVDMNYWCLQQAARKVNSRARFVHRDSEAFQELRDIDAIFCMAVFQRTEHRTQARKLITEGFTFARFEQEISLLDRKLKPGGFLFIDHCDFHFGDTAISSSYEPFLSPATLRVYKHPIFDRQNQLLATGHVATRIYRKKPLPLIP